MKVKTFRLSASLKRFCINTTNTDVRLGLLASSECKYFRNKPTDSLKIALFKTYPSSYPHLVLVLGIRRYVPLYSCCEEYRSQIQSRNFSGVYHGKSGALSFGIYSLVSLPQQILPWNKKKYEPYYWIFITPILGRIIKSESFYRSCLESLIIHAKHFDNTPGIEIDFFFYHCNYTVLLLNNLTYWRARNAKKCLKSDVTFICCLQRIF